MEKIQKSEKKMKEFVDKFVDEVNIIDEFFVKKYTQYLDEFTHLQTQYISRFDNVDEETSNNVFSNNNSF